MMELSRSKTDLPMLFVCSCCGRSFGKNCSLRRHCRQMHGNLQQPECQRSGRKVQTVPGLPDGQSGAGFQCAVCRKSYSRRNALKWHQKCKHPQLPAASQRVGTCTGEVMQADSAIPFSADGSAVTQITSYETCKRLSAFRVSLHEHEIVTHTKFVCVESRRSFTDKSYHISSNKRILWNGPIPYILLSARLYDCHQGNDRNVTKKRKYAAYRKQQQNADHGFVRRRNAAQPTKKLQCPAHFSLRRVISFENFKVTELKNVDEKRRESAEALKRALLQQPELSGEECFLFRFPALEDHKFHNMGIASSLTQGLDHRVREKIKEIYSRKRCSITVVQALVEEFVTLDLEKTNRMDRRFFPEHTMVRSVIHSLKKRERWSKIDLHNIKA